MAEGGDELRELRLGALAMLERPRRACIDVRGDAADPQFARAVAAVTDLRLPTASCSSTAGLLASLLWLGPSEWLAVSETQDPATLAASLRRAVQGVAGAVTDVSDARIVYALSGEGVRTVLAKGCPLDLHPRAFAPGACAQTLLAKTSIIVHRVADSVFEIYVARSLRDYAWAWLEQAAREFDVDTAPRAERP